MSLAALIRSMADAGAPPEAIALAVEAIEARDAKASERDAADAVRKANLARARKDQRARKAATVADLSRDIDTTVARHDADIDATVADTTPPSPPSVSPPRDINSTPLSTPLSPSPNSRGMAGLAAEFDDEFWPIWPSKVGKAAASKAFFTIRRSGVPLQTILDGIRRYVASKPPDRDWMNPATFLNGRRFNDEIPPPVQSKGSGGGWATLMAESMRERNDGERSNLQNVPVLSICDKDGSRPSGNDDGGIFGDRLKLLVGGSLQRMRDA